MATMMMSLRQVAEMTDQIADERYSEILRNIRGEQWSDKLLLYKIFQLTNNRNLRSLDEIRSLVFERMREKSQQDF